MALAVLLALNLAAPFVVLGVLAKFVFSARRGLLRDLPTELDERLGGLPRQARAKLAGRPVLWVHAASAGEVAAVSEILRRLRERPGAPAVLLSTTTRAGREAAARLASVDAAVLAPIDCWPAVRRFLRQARPYALVLVETELWPNMIELAARAGLRIGVVNGRISERSFPRYRRIARLLHPFFARIDRVAARTEADGRRFAALGIPADRVLVAGNMKYDRLSSGDERGRAELVRLGWQGSAVLVAASTHPGEEEIILEAFTGLRRRFPALKLVMAPRHVERADDAAEALRKAELCFCRLGGEAPAEACVLLVDAMGWLPSFFACAAAAFVGGTMVPVGGHNVLEPALAGVPVLFGPHTGHTQEAADALKVCGGGFQAADAAALARIMERLLAEPEFSADSGLKAQALVRSLQGATQRTLEHLGPVLALPLRP
ncbi:MAG: 3-deoxy-D-manno-octulosonic acid transferase [Elusimicrobia bacterium]|nr:3-deoxy-D-manno-octulosonic acid transferase [Elusimicrobiota bacterium]